MFLLKKYFGYLMAAEKEPVTSTDTSTEGTTTKDPDTSDGITISKATLVVKDKAGNVGIVNGLTNKDISTIKAGLDTVATHTKNISTLTKNLSTEVSDRKTAVENVSAAVTAEASTRKSADDSLTTSVTNLTNNVKNNYVTLGTTQTISGYKTFSNGLNAKNTICNFGGIELYRDYPYIDFHYGQNTSDYTARIAEESTGNLHAKCTSFNISGIGRTTTPNTSSNDTTIPTTAWVNTKASNYVTLNTAQTITKSKTFNSNMFMFGPNQIDIRFGDYNGKRYGQVRATGSTTSDKTISIQAVSDADSSATHFGGILTAGINDISEDNVSYTICAADKVHLSANSYTEIKTPQINFVGNWVNLKTTPSVSTNQKMWFKDVNYTPYAFLGTVHQSNNNRYIELGNYNNSTGKYYAGYRQYYNPSNNEYWAEGMNLVPTGAIIAWAASGWVPDGFFYCNGAAVSRTKYKHLFETIGTKWGAGDGSTTFNIPDARERFLEDSTIGKVFSAGLPNIQGAFWNFATLDANIGTNGPFSLLWQQKLNWGMWENSKCPMGDASVQFKAQDANSIYGNSSTVQPPAIGVTFMIKY